MDALAKAQRRRKETRRKKANAQHVVLKDSSSSIAMAGPRWRPRRFSSRISWKQVHYILMSVPGVGP